MKAKNRISSLDGLRTISITLVIVSHFLNSAGYNDPLVMGNLGVRVFFIISGFLISGLLIRELENKKTIDLWKFYYRRTMRIFPPFYFSLGVMSLFALVGVVQIPLGSFVPALAYISNYVSTNNWNLSHSWSLAVEEQFYLLLPGVLVLVGKRRAVAVLGAVLVASPIIRVVSYQLLRPAEPIWLHAGFPANMDALATGCLLAFVGPLIRRNSLYNRLVGSTMIWLVVPGIVLANMQGQHPNIYAGVCVSLMNVGIALVVDHVVTHSKTTVGKVLNSRLFVQVGVMSYSIYLWQQPFMERGSRLSIVSNPLNVAFFILAVAASYLVVERYSLRIREWLEPRFLNAIPRRLEKRTPTGISEPSVVDA